MMMGKTGWIVLLVSAMTLSACSAQEVKTAKKNTKGSEISINVEKPISIISFKIRAKDSVEMTGFEGNQAVFNTELKNTGNNLEREVHIAAMKSPEEMPSGEIVLGTILHKGGGEVEIVEINAVESGEAGSEVVEKKIDSFKLYLKK